MNKLDTTIKQELPKVNQLLQRQKLAPIKAEPAKPDEQKDKPKGDKL